MARTLIEIAAILDSFADATYQLAGAIAGQDRLREAGAELFDDNGQPIDFRELARELRDHEARQSSD